MGSRICGDECRTTVVCIDVYRDGVPGGRFYNPYLPQWECFQSLTQFLTKMEHTLDSMHFPQAFAGARSFAPPPKRKEDGPPGFDTPNGRVATFAVRVRFRQNASWQGSLTWLEKGLEQSFRSVLELILLMDSVLSEIEYKPAKQVPALSSDLGRTTTSDSCPRAGSRAEYNF